MDEDMVLRFWAKTGREGGTYQFHPLLYHMLDVAAVASLVWDNSLDKVLRRRLFSSLGDEAKSWTMFLAGAHDIGKASPGFQKKAPWLSRDLGLRFSVNDQDRPHGIISARVLNEFLSNSQTSVLLGQIAGGHHGVFPRSADLQMGSDTLGNAAWREARNNLLDELAGAMGFARDRKPGPVDMADPLIVPLLAGFISVMDWIASNQDFFPVSTERGQRTEFDPIEYFKTAESDAQRALRMLGWIPSVVFAEEAPFANVFPDLTANTLQSKVAELTSKQDSPYLMIVEAPMGQGKTEAALYAADLALSREFARGIYVAMPTQATSNAMFKRILDYLKQRGHKGRLNLQLVHADALLAPKEEVDEGEIPAFQTKNVNVGEGNIDTEAQSWFTAKKRPLLAPFGVGTIDQSLLSVLQTRHWFVRLFGLAGKVVIFDEVHAYDAYMSTILERLLQWLAEADCTVILLSATLPEAKRNVLIEAYSGGGCAEEKPYPRVTLAQPRRCPNKQVSGGSVCAEVPVSETRRITLHFANTEHESLSAMLAQRLEHGGCAALICNTVDRSIEVYRHLRDSLKETEFFLFHARTLQMWRREREQEVLHKFGKGRKEADGMYTNPDRPHRAILVATQVIEQSLDLDFDLIVSDIAPVDLLLQRAGRLHRHPRVRPEGLKTPELIVLCDAQREEQPPESFGRSIEYVYDRYILLRTWLALRGKDTIEVPTEIEGLVETVYGQDGMILDNCWTEVLAVARKKMEFEQSESKKAANKLLVPEPGDPADIVETFNTQLVDDEDPEVHKAIRAATREGDPSVTVVMVDANTTLSAEPTLAEVRDFLDHSAKLSRKGIYHALSNEVVPPEWENNAHLSYARLLSLDEQSQARVGEFMLTVDEELGIVIEKEGEDDE